ncbi:MAG TPA: RNA-binding protein [Terriglobia bacterium]|nr:RNA-binding protein [Terriglobia bacterium]
MSKKVFIGNLPFQTTESDLTNTFAQYGRVESVQIITDRETGRSKGFGFIVMDEQAADEAIAEISGSMVDGRTLTVNEAKPRIRINSGGGNSHGRRAHDRY